MYSGCVFLTTLISFNLLSGPCVLSVISFRDQNEVLTEDREKLRVLQPLQPWFSQEQRQELAEVHPWIQQHTIPQEIDTQVGIFDHTPTIIYCSSFYSAEYRFKCIFCVSQGCVSCNAATGQHSPLPTAPDSSCPLECPEQDAIGPVDDI